MTLVESREGMEIESESFSIQLPAGRCEIKDRRLQLENAEIFPIELGSEGRV